mmetsp:Transcript_35379/g.74277  ORF Transcript_35379/g.74277 Transcript_35379/m.74277 type:complete len:89 (+) Transcript_35379:143-409(+)|eukprot:3771826-Pleurochrysis_carterae.AAC.1
MGLRHTACRSSFICIAAKACAEQDISNWHAALENALSSPRCGEGWYSALQGGHQTGFELGVRRAVVFLALFIVPVWVALRRRRDASQP